MILVESCFEFHMFFNCRNAALALPTVAFTSACEPLCSPMMLSRVAIDQSHVDICASSADCLDIVLSQKLYKQSWVMAST
ncbi:unnamed protein product [Schistosoma margrebowiei]|uniref:Uncharacterized protein n=1 Tax=Schistosoma margrebowiei TaxID=48269 RepID=A0A3P7ZE05_9TREM|nr:unnamed protein product [Schistosoma margrebowiei]